jgi:hypothetical protein
VKCATPAVRELGDACKVLSKLGLTCSQNYRYWLIYLVPSLRYLDYSKIRDVERTKATELFGTAEEPTELTTTIRGTKSKGFVVPSFANGGADTPTKERIWTESEKAKMRAAIRSASSLAEMARLEKDFMEGRIPAYVLEGGDPMET